MVGHPQSHIQSLLLATTEAGLLQRQKAQELPPKAWKAGETALAGEHSSRVPSRREK